MMSLLYRTWALLVTVIRRLRSRAGLALATLLGLVTAISLTLAVPLYADAIYYRTFRQEVTEGVENRPPFTFRFTFNGGWSGPAQWEKVEPLDHYFQETAHRRLGLPRDQIIRTMRTAPISIFPVDTSNYNSQQNGLAWVSYAFVSALETQVTLLEGRIPASDGGKPTQDDPVEILVSDELASELGLQVGEMLVAYAEHETDTGQVVGTALPFRISGVWQVPQPANNSNWVVQSTLNGNQLLMPESAFVNRISPYLPDEIYTAHWTLVMNGDSVRADEVNTLLRRIATVEREASTLLPGTGLGLSPVEALQTYSASARLLTVFLYAFSVPIIGLVLAFISLTANLNIERQRNETAVLRSRGATSGQIVSMALIEGVLLNSTAFVVSLPVAMGLAHLIGYTRSFLDFSGQGGLDVRITRAALQLGLLTVVVALLATLLPALRASKHTIITYAQDRSRLLRRPWWQRAGLDLLLLIPAGYGTYLMQQQGSLLANGVLSDDPFQNPLLFLVPALAILAIALLFLRLIPLLLKVIAWMVAHTRGQVGLVLATHHLARMPAAYSTPLLILVLTLSLSTYVASLAYTLDHHLHDQTYYQLGADLRLTNVGDSASPTYGQVINNSGFNDSPWFFLPISAYRQVDGVANATRVGRYTTTATVGNGEDGDFLGIDRADFPGIAFWRPDFAPASLGGLMNNLAVHWNGVLVPRDFMARHNLRTGDALRLTVQTYGKRSELDMRIVGHFEFFPSWYPSDGPLFVGNLDYLFEQLGSEVPYHVWMDVGTQANPVQVAEEGLRTLDAPRPQWEAASVEITAVQEQPERQGMFGLLFIGFAAAALLTAFGFLLYVLFSFHRRAVELGVWRASGLSRGQMASYLAWELLFLLLLGSGAGAALGIGAGRLYIPFLQIGLEPSALVPPFQVTVAWSSILQVYLLFAVLFAVTLVSLLFALNRMKIFQTIKLGETV